MSGPLLAAQATMDQIARMQGKPLPPWATVLSVSSDSTGPQVVYVDAGMDEQLDVTHWSSWFAQEMANVGGAIVGRTVRVEWNASQPVITYSLVTGQANVDATDEELA